MLNSIVSHAKACAAVLFALGAATVSAQTVTVVEYYNKAIDAHFITARTNEQAALDGAADFQRTGMTFQAVAAASATASQTKICRFYISLVTPYTSSHFYGRQGTDCEVLLAQNLPGFTYEDYDFATQQPTAGACPSGTVGIYRGFRAGANGKTSNHRYSASLATYNSAIAAGYVGEGIVFCATGATPASGTVVTPPVGGSGDCAPFVLARNRITTQSTQTIGGVSTSSTSTVVYDYDLTPVIFNGRSAARQITSTTYGGSTVAVTGSSYFQDNANDYSLLGSRFPGTTVNSDIYYEPPLAYPKRFATGQKLDYTYSIIFNPSEPSLGNGSVTGSTTFLGMESVTVPAGTFNACKFKVDDSIRYVTAGSTSVSSTTSWIMPGVGTVRLESNDTYTMPGSPASTSSYVVVATVIQ